MQAAGSADAAALTALESAKRDKEAAAAEVTKTAHEAEAKAHDAADVLAKQKKVLRAFHQFTVHCTLLVTTQ